MLNLEDTKVDFSTEQFTKKFKNQAKKIDNSKKSWAVQVNSELTILFWHVCKQINDFVLQNQRADYGKRIISTLSTQLEKRYGRNFEEKNLRRMMQFAEQFNDF